MNLYKRYNNFLDGKVEIKLETRMLVLLFDSLSPSLLVTPTELNRSKS